MRLANDTEMFFSYLKDIFLNSNLVLVLTKHCEEKQISASSPLLSGEEPVGVGWAVPPAENLSY